MRPMFGTRVVIADADAEYREKLKETLLQAGYMVAGSVGNGRSALKAIFQTEPDIIIMDSKLPGAEGMEITRIIEEHRVAPFLLLASGPEQELLESAKFSWVFAILVKPVNNEQLFTAIELAIANFKRIIKLETENKRLKKALEERKLVEKAKGLLMEQKGICEKDAYKLLQKLSMNRCLPIGKIARQVITYYSNKRD